MNDGIMFRLAGEHDPEPKQCRHRTSTESSIVLPSELRFACSECALDGTVFSKSERSRHPDDRILQDCEASALGLQLVKPQEAFECFM